MHKEEKKKWCWTVKDIFSSSSLSVSQVLWQSSSRYVHVLSQTHTHKHTHVHLHTPKYMFFFILCYKYTCRSTHRAQPHSFCHTHQILYTSCWDSDMCCRLIQLFYLLNNLASIELGERERGRRRRKKRGKHGCAERIKANQYQWAVCTAWTSHHVTQQTKFRKKIL